MFIRILTLFLTWLALSAHALEAGKDYILLDVEPLTELPGKVEIREFFWYGCPHCYDLEPSLNHWVSLKKEDEQLYFTRSPVQFRPNWQLHAKAFFSSIALGKENTLHSEIFSAIHEKNQFLSTESELAAFFAAHDVNEKEFKNIFHSFGVATAATQANALAVHYKITQVPTVIINGKYKVSTGMSGSFERFLEVVDELILLEKKALKQRDGKTSLESQGTP